MRLPTKLIILSIFLFGLTSCRVGVVVKDSPHQGKRKKFEVDARDNFLIIKRSSNTSIYIFQDSILIDTVSH